MSLRIFNSRRRKKRNSFPFTEGKIGIYVCGITAYDVCHVGMPVRPSSLTSSPVTSDTEATRSPT